MKFYNNDILNQELNNTVIKQVRVHVGARSTIVLLGVIETGYTRNDKCRISGEI
jgi:hypothetical protein